VSGESGHGRDTEVEKLQQILANLPIKPALVEELVTNLRHLHERLRHLEWSGSEHTMLQEDWDATCREACAWFGRFLDANQPGAPEPLDSAPRAALRSAP